MKKNALKKELDWVSMLVPLAIVLTVCALFMISRKVPSSS